MKVYVVTEGYQNEGEGPFGVYATLEGAWKAVGEGKARSPVTYGTGPLGETRVGEIGMSKDHPGLHIIREVEVL